MDGADHLMRRPTPPPSGPVWDAVVTFGVPDCYVLFKRTFLTSTCWRPCRLVQYLEYTFVHFPVIMDLIGSAVAVLPLSYCESVILSAQVILMKCSVKLHIVVIPAKQNHRQPRIIPCSDITGVLRALRGKRQNARPM